MRLHVLYCSGGGLKAGTAKKGGGGRRGVGFTLLLLFIVSLFRGAFSTHTYIFPHYEHQHVCMCKYVRVYTVVYVCSFLLYACARMHTHARTHHNKRGQTTTSIMYVLRSKNVLLKLFRVPEGGK